MHSGIITSVHRDESIVLISIKEMVRCVNKEVARRKRINASLFVYTLDRGIISMYAEIAHLLAQLD